MPIRLKLADVIKGVEVFREGRSIENPAGAKWFSLACEALAVVLVLGSLYAAQRGLLDQSLSIPQALDFAQVVIGSFFGLLGLARAANVAADPARGLPAKRLQLDRLDELPTGAARHAEAKRSPLADPLVSGE